METKLYEYSYNTRKAKITKTTFFVKETKKQFKVLDAHEKNKNDYFSNCKITKDKDELNITTFFFGTITMTSLEDDINMFKNKIAEHFKKEIEELKQKINEKEKELEKLKNIQGE